MRRLLVIGAGGHGRAVAEAAELGVSHAVAGFLDDAPDVEHDIWGIPVWGSSSMLAELLGRVDEVVVAIGNNTVRRALHQRVRETGLTLATIVHPAALLSPRAVVGPGSVLMAGAIVGTQARLGEGVIVNCGAVVDHDCVVENFGHLGVKAGMAGGAVLGAGAWMQAGSSLGYGVTVPSASVLRPGESRAAG